MTTDYDEGKFKQLLATLNQAYDTFKKKYGYLNQAVNVASLTEMTVILLSQVLN
ncbi:MAG: hypothetical protein ACLRX9_00660 [Streptococcus salivarius]